MKITLLGDPRTKKNSQRIIRTAKYSRILPSLPYSEYEGYCLQQMKSLQLEERGIWRPINLRCVYYMHTRRRVDLVNLLEATQDILVKAGVLTDDNSGVVASVDGSEVRYDKENPRVEIEIVQLEGKQ